MITEREDDNGLQAHHLIPGMELPEEEDEERGFDPDVAAAYDELAKVAKRKRRVH